MTAGFFLRSVVRESRGSRGRLLFLAACLAVGVAAVVAVDGLTGGIEAGVRAKSREVMGADLSVEGRRPLPKELDGLLADQPGIERSDLREMATMAALAGPDGTPRRARLCQLRVVRGRYPLHGALTTEPAAPLDRLLADDRSAVAARELLDALGIGVGDRFLVGGAEFRVAASLEKEAGRVGLQAMLGPRVYLTDAGLARTKLTGVGNRVLHRALFALPGDPPKERLDALARRLEKDLPGASFLDVDTHHGVDANQGRAMERLSSTVALTALLSLVLGGIGVAQIVRAWLEGRASAVAVLRCLGMRPGEILAFHLGHVAILAIAGSLAGAAVGAVAPLLVPALAPELFPLEHFRAFSPAALLRGVGLGVGVAMLFALPPLTAIWRVPPARVLRAEADPLPAPRGVSAAAAILLGTG
ncbi:MAG TPA: FtsX-like permease family protein, partial [Planctomycetota bacterium]|nr:FtsX-like permease family protein [Planctomycetota bacterium]